MMRYGGSWHLERRTLFPGYVFLSGDMLPLKECIPLVPCEPPYMKELCQEDNLVALSRGVIRNGNTVVTSGPLKGREGLIRRINRHRRTAEIEIPFRGKTVQVTVGLEIYEKVKG